MTTQLSTTSASAMTDQIIRQVLTLWNTESKRVTSFFTQYDDSIYQKEVAPGRNRAIYLLGHFIAVNDGILPLFGLGERLYPELQQPFLGPDKSIEVFPPIAELKQKWAELDKTLSAHFSSMNANDWLGKHTAVSEEAFKNEPHRNKLNVLLSRTNHMSYHMGQLNLLSA